MDSNKDSISEVLCVVSTRPEAIKMAPVIIALRELAVPTKVLTTGQHVDMLPETLDIFGLRTNVDLKLMKPGMTAAGFMGAAVQGLTDYLSVAKPACALAQGDTTSVLAAAMACFFHRIPFGHVEAGLRSHSFTHPFPEEYNRRIADLGAEWAFCPTQEASDNLRDENVHRRFITGNTVIDAVKLILGKREREISKNNRPYIVVTMHRREAMDKIMSMTFEAIKMFAADHVDVDIVIPVHPNPEVVKRAAVFDGVANIRKTLPMRYDEFINVLANAQCVVTDSGGIQEEATYLGIPMLITRLTTERPEALGRMACTLSAATSLDAIGIYELLCRIYAQSLISCKKKSNVFGNGKAGKCIADIISYWLSTRDTQS